MSSTIAGAPLWFAYAATLALIIAPPVCAQAGGEPDKNLVREQYEWSNIWWDCANDPKLPRVLLIGDSISCGYSAVVTKLLEGKYHVDRLGTSRSINDPVLIKETKMMLEDSKYVAIHFNNGLHGFHLDGPTYAAALDDYIALLKKLGGGAKLIWGSSTPITKGGDVNTLSDGNAKVLERNAAALPIMERNGIPVDDLYQLVVGKSDLRAGDGYHYNGPGYDVLGKAVADAVLAAVQ
jgi:hypothetical protein